MLYKLDTIQCLVRRAVGKGENLTTHVGQVILCTRVVGLFQNIMNEVDRRLCSSMNFLTKRLLNKTSQMLFGLDRLLINHLFLLCRQTACDCGYWGVVAERQTTTQRRVSNKDLDLYIFVVQTRQFFNVTIVNIVQMHTRTTLAEFRIGGRPL